MATRFDPLWRLRLARDDAAAATREAVEFCHAVERGEVTEPDLVVRGKSAATSLRLSVCDPVGVHS